MCPLPTSIPILTQATSPVEKELNIPSHNIVSFQVEDAKQRTLQQGFLTKSNKLVWGLSCQSFPAWLFVLNSANCKEIHIRDFTSSEGFLASCNNSIIVSQALAYLGADTFKFLGSDSSKVNFNLVSGDLDYLRATSSTFASSPALYLLDIPWRSRNVPHHVNGITWKIFPPTAFGGGVNWRVLCGFQGLSPLTITCSLLRSIGHFLSHSVRPRVIDVSSLNATSFYSATSLLHPSLHDKPLQYTTTFSYSGWGERTLTPEEIAGCYGFSDLQKTNITLSLCQGLIPLQPLRYFITELTEIAGSRIHQPFDPQPTPPVLPVQPRSWLPSIQRFSVIHGWMVINSVSLRQKLIMLQCLHSFGIIDVVFLFLS